jgi:hypothetical protein
LNDPFGMTVSPFARCAHLQRRVPHGWPATSLQGELMPGLEEAPTESTEGVMKGVITGREILSNLWLVWKEFGAGCVVRCLWACMKGHGATFLDVAVKPRVR